MGKVAVKGAFSEVDPDDRQGRRERAKAIGWLLGGGLGAATGGGLAFAAQHNLSRALLPKGLTITNLTLPIIAAGVMGGAGAKLGDRAAYKIWRSMNPPRKPSKEKTSQAKLDGVYKGRSTSSSSIKKTEIFQGIKLYIDRPKGFIMRGHDAEGHAWERTYKYDYGFIPKTLGGDGDGLDVFIGPDKKSTDAFWAVQRKPDGSFDEYKVFLGFPSRDAATAAFRDHIPKKLMKGMVTMKVSMMKAMLGMDPEGHGIIKAAMLASMQDELSKVLKDPEAEATLNLLNRYKRHEQLIRSAEQLKAEAKELVG